MSAAVETRELSGITFACLEGCGFCCTFPAEVTTRELALLRARMKPRPVAVTVGDGRSYLGLQNKCGACTLLERRACTAYDLRPSHCRYFPFHVHFAETPEVYVNYACRGVAFAPAGDATQAFERQVLATATPEALRERDAEARATYAEFKRRALRAGAWGDVDATAADALAAGAAMLSARWLQEAIGRAGEDATPDDLVEDALAPFAADDVTKRPFYLDERLRWLTFDAPDPATLRLLEMDERGALVPLADLARPRGWADPPAPVAAQLAGYARRLATRRLFAGSVYAIVDDAGYESSVVEATWWRLAEIVADLATRARILAAIGVPEDRLADETARFYDSSFLDSPTIGGFL